MGNKRIHIPGVMPSDGICNPAYNWTIKEALDVYCRLNPGTRRRVRGISIGKKRKKK
jgi:hypothetical protein